MGSDTIINLLNFLTSLMQNLFNLKISLFVNWNVFHFKKDIGHSQNQVHIIFLYVSLRI